MSLQTTEVNREFDVEATWTSAGNAGSFMQLILGVETQGWVDEFEFVKTAESSPSRAGTAMQISTMHSATQTSIDVSKLAYGDAAKVTQAVPVCGCQHSSLRDTYFVVPRARHDLLQLHVGDVGLVKDVCPDNVMIKIMFPDLGTAFITWLEADCCFQFL